MDMTQMWTTLIVSWMLMGSSKVQGGLIPQYNYDTGDYHYPEHRDYPGPDYDYPNLEFPDYIRDKMDKFEIRSYMGMCPQLDWSFCFFTNIDLACPWEDQEPSYFTSERDGGLCRGCMQCKTPGKGDENKENKPETPNGVGPENGDQASGVEEGSGTELKNEASKQVGTEVSQDDGSENGEESSNAFETDQGINDDAGDIDDVVVGDSAETPSTSENDQTNVDESETTEVDESVQEENIHENGNEIQGEEPSENEQAMGEEQPSENEQAMGEEQPSENEQAMGEEQPSENEQAMGEEQPSENEQAMGEEQPSENEQAMGEEQPSENEQAMGEKQPSENEQAVGEEQYSEDEQASEGHKSKTDEQDSTMNEDNQKSNTDKNDSANTMASPKSIHDFAGLHFPAFPAAGARWVAEAPSDLVIAPFVSNGNNGQNGVDEDTQPICPSLDCMEVERMLPCGVQDMVPRMMTIPMASGNIECPACRQCRS